MFGVISLREISKILDKSPWNTLGISNQIKRVFLFVCFCFCFLFCFVFLSFFFFFFSFFVCLFVLFCFVLFFNVDQNVQCWVLEESWNFN